MLCAQLCQILLSGISCFFEASASLHAQSEASASLHIRMEASASKFFRGFVLSGSFSHEHSMDGGKSFGMVARASSTCSAILKSPTWHGPSNREEPDCNVKTPASIMDTAWRNAWEWFRGVVVYGHGHRHGHGHGHRIFKHGAWVWGCSQLNHIRRAVVNVWSGTVRAEAVRTVLPATPRALARPLLL